MAEAGLDWRAMTEGGRVNRKWVDTGEAARAESVTRRTVERWAREQRILARRATRQSPWRIAVDGEGFTIER